MFPWQNLGPIAHGIDVEKQNLIAVSLHHTVAQGFINTSKLGPYDWMFGSH